MSIIGPGLVDCTEGHGDENPRGVRPRGEFHRAMLWLWSFITHTSPQPPGIHTSKEADGQIDEHEKCCARRVCKEIDVENRGSREPQGLEARQR